MNLKSLIESLTKQILNENSNLILKNLSHEFSLSNAVEFMGPLGEQKLDQLWQSATDSVAMTMFLKTRTKLWDKYEQTWNANDRPGGDYGVFQYVYAKQIVEMAQEILSYTDSTVYSHDAVKLQRAAKILGINLSQNPTPEELKAFKAMLKAEGEQRLDMLKVKAIRNIIPQLRATDLEIRRG